MKNLFIYSLFVIIGLSSCDSTPKKKLIFSEQFDDSEKLNTLWVPQLFTKSGQKAGFVKIENGKLDVLSESGCTIWLNKELSGNIEIQYDVTVDTSNYSHLGKVMISDVNCFWMATAPNNKDLLHDPSYNGQFKSYHDMHAYYASLGGRFNTTTRARRYPRKEKNRNVRHLYLKSQDHKVKIQPNQVMHIKLISQNGKVEYFVNNELVYAFVPNKKVEIGIDPLEETHEGIYQLNRFPAYNKGYFGLRLTTSHHLYDNIKVYQLL